MGRMLLLLPADPVSSRRPDAHFAPEASAARAAGHATALLDHDALQAGRAGEAARRVPADEDVVYRGWMVTVDQYEDLEHELGLRGARLRTSAQQYRRAHQLPGWYEQLSALTPQSCWTHGDDPGQLLGCCRLLGSGAAVLRDYSKSMKHYWQEAAFVGDVSDVEAVSRVAARFRELREDAFDGGYVLRRYEPFVGAEVRSWWVDGRCALLTAHPDTPTDQPQVSTAFLDELAGPIAALALPFASADLVRLDDGRWRVVELGDGQVSDRPTTCPAQP